MITEIGYTKRELIISYSWYTIYLLIMVASIYLQVNDHYIAAALFMFQVPLIMFIRYNRRRGLNE